MHKRLRLSVVSVSIPVAELDAFEEMHYYHIYKCISVSLAREIEIGRERGSDPIRDQYTISLCFITAVWFCVFGVCVLIKRLVLIAKKHVYSAWYFLLHNALMADRSTCGVESLFKHQATNLFWVNRHNVTFSLQPKLFF